MITHKAPKHSKQKTKNKYIEQYMKLFYWALFNIATAHANPKYFFMLNKLIFHAYEAMIKFNIYYC